MFCDKCICRFCVYSCELDLRYRTPSEIDEYCWTCDECKHYGGDHTKRSQWRTECPKFQEPAKRTEHLAEMARRKMKVVGGRSQ